MSRALKELAMFTLGVVMILGVFLVSFLLGYIGHQLF